MELVLSKLDWRVIWNLSLKKCFTFAIEGHTLYMNKNHHMFSFLWEARVNICRLKSAKATSDSLVLWAWSVLHKFFRHIIIVFSWNFSCERSRGRPSQEHFASVRRPVVSCCIRTLALKSTNLEMLLMPTWGLFPLRLDRMWLEGIGHDDRESI